MRNEKIAPGSNLPRVEHPGKPDLVPSCSDHFLLEIILVEIGKKHIPVRDLQIDLRKVHPLHDRDRLLKEAVPAGNENIPSLLRNYRKNLSFSVKGFSNKGLPEFMYQYKAVGVTVRDEEILLSAVEELLVAMAKYLA